VVFDQITEFGFWQESDGIVQHVKNVVATHLSDGGSELLTIKWPAVHVSLHSPLYPARFIIVVSGR
jgi:hypothetical protein